ncbi:MAG: hypothetical protein WBB36_03035, partial [Chitinophagales bacterium]
MIKLFLLLLLISLQGSSVFSQSTFIPLNDASYHFLQRLEIKSGNISDQLHFSALPLQRENAIQFLDTFQKKTTNTSSVDLKSIEYLLTDNDEWSAYAGANSRKPFMKYIY